MKKPQRFVYRANSANEKINNLLSTEASLANLNRDLTDTEKDNFCLEIKFAYEYCWKVMKDYLKFHKIQELLPRKIFQAMNHFFDTSKWIQLTDEINTFLNNRKDIENKNLLIKHYYEDYSKMFDDFLHFITNQSDVADIEDLKKQNSIYANNYILDTYTFVTLIDFFLSKPEIEEVYIFGSRVRDSWRESSDIDLIIKGDIKYTNFLSIQQDADKLLIPYLLDLHNYSAKTPFDIKFNKMNIKEGILIYKRRDFINI